MKKRCILILFFFSIFLHSVSAQQVLPAITVKNLNGKIIVSWLNEYKKSIQNIFIQRSYDSLKNYTTIGTVLNPQNTENGYPDVNPPYNKMYYRISITFEGGTYIIGPATRPIKEVFEPEPIDITAIPIEELPLKTTIPEIKDVVVKDLTLNKKNELVPESINKKKNDSLNDSKLTTLKTIVTPSRIVETAFPSYRIYTSKQNIVVIHMPEANNHKYQIKFFDESEKLIFEIKKITEEYLYLEKSNFIRSGWFRFEIFEDGVLIEKNKVLIGKDKLKQTN